MKKTATYKAILISFFLAGHVSAELKTPPNVQIYDNSLTINISILGSFDKGVSNYEHYINGNGKGVRFSSSKKHRVSLYDIFSVPINKNHIQLSAIYKTAKNDANSTNVTISENKKLGQNIKYYKKDKSNYTMHVTFIHDQKLNDITIYAPIDPFSTLTDNKYKVLLNDAMTNFINSINLKHVK